jgi:hypothetical protein
VASARRGYQAPRLLRTFDQEGFHCGIRQRRWRDEGLGQDSINRSFVRSWAVRESNPRPLARHAYLVDSRGRQSAGQGPFADQVDVDGHPRTAAFG